MKEQGQIANINFKNKLKLVSLKILIKMRENMINQFHAIYELDGDWYVSYCPEIPGANGMGKTQSECRDNLIESIRLILLDRYEDSMKSITDNITNELITVQ